MTRVADNATADAGPSTPVLLAMFERMTLIRRTEERLGALFLDGKLPAGVHLYIGQEACAVGVCAHLNDGDFITSTHRGHGHFLAKGGDMAAMVAEIHAKDTGVCHGMGGTMHVADVSKGILGANGIVGAGVGIATGAAFACQLAGRGQVAVCFQGDGACNQGVFMEALNLAALWRLPLIMVCENNGWSEFTATERVTAGSIAERAAPFGLPYETADGNDILAVHAAAGRAVARARAGQGATVLEFKTYRTRGHVEAERFFLSAAYRPEAEVEAWAAAERDPLARCSAILSARQVPDETLRTIETAIDAAIDAAVAAAEAAPYPDPSRLEGLMFAPDREPAHG